MIKKDKIILIFLISLVPFTLFGVFYDNNLLEIVNNRWGERFVKKQIIYDKDRVLWPILREIEIVKVMAKDPDIIEFALNDNNPNIQKKGIEVLERYRLKFHDKNYFAGFSKSKNYYYNDIENNYINNELCYTLSPNNIADKWFYESIHLDGEYQINVNRDMVLGTTKVWINYILRDNNKIIGIIGTGLDLSKFIKESVGIKQEGVRNLFINKDLAIQLEENVKLIDYSSITKQGKSNNSLEIFVKDKKDIKYIKRMMHELEISKDSSEVKVFNILFEGTIQLVGLTYLKELGWFSLTIVDFAIFNVIVCVIVFFILIGALILLWNYLLRKKVKEEVLKNIKKEKELLKSTKHAEVGKLIANIAHQWLAPLQQLNLITIATALELKYERKIDDNMLTERCNEIKDTIDFMSNTMHTFLNFYKVSTKSTKFNLYDSVTEIIDISGIKINITNLSIILTGDKSTEVEGIKNEWMQIWLNLINNSRNIFIEREIKNPNIKINIMSNCITFTDNGGGKDFTQETNGLGLSMCDEITKKYGATLEFENILYGFSVHISLS